MMLDNVTFMLAPFIEREALTHQAGASLLSATDCMAIPALRHKWCPKPFASPTCGKVLPIPILLTQTEDQRPRSIAEDSPVEGPNPLLAVCHSHGLLRLVVDWIFPVLVEHSCVFPNEATMARSCFPSGVGELCEGHPCITFKIIQQHVLWASWGSGHGSWWWRWW